MNEEEIKYLKEHPKEYWKKTKELIKEGIKKREEQENERRRAKI